MHRQFTFIGIKYFGKSHKKDHVWSSPAHRYNQTAFVFGMTDNGSAFLIDYRKKPTG